MSINKFIFSKLNKKVTNLSKKYNGVPLYKIIFTKSTIKEKLFCFNVFLIVILYGAFVGTLFLLTCPFCPFYKLNKWCKTELWGD